MKDYSTLIGRITYNPETGELFYLKRVGWKDRGLAVRSIDGCGYIRLWVDNVSFLAHRAAWFLTYGEPPVLHLDHINGDRADNRLVNLRPANYKQNGANRKPQSSCGVHGVVWHKRDCKWQAQIKVNGKPIFLGYFETIEEAQAARIAAEEKYHGDYGHHVSRGKV